MDKLAITQTDEAPSFQEEGSECDAQSEVVFKQVHTDKIIRGLGPGRESRESQPWLAVVVASAMASARDAVITVGGDQRILFFNKAAEKVFGCPAAEALGRPLELFIPNRFRQQYREQIALIGQKKPGVRELWPLGIAYGLRANGEEFPVEASVSHVTVGGQKLFTAILRDVTERQRAEQALRESEEHFRLLFDSAPVMIWISGTDARCTFFNQPWLNFTGRTMEQELGDGWAQGVHPEDYQRCLDIYLTAFDARESFSMEYRLRRADGEYRYVLENGIPRFTSAGFVGFIGSCIDITERKQMEKALRESEARFRNMADHAPVMVWVTEADGTCTYVSQSWCEFTGQTPEIARGFGWVAALHPDDRELAEKTFLAANEKREAYRQEYRLRHKDGQCRWVIDSAAPRYSSQDEFLGYIGSVVDITGRKQTEEALRHSEERFRHAFDHAATGMTLTAPDGRWLEVNHSICQMLGYSRQELLAIDFQSITHPDDLEANLALLRQTLAGGAHKFQLEKRYIHKDGHTVWALLGTSLMRDRRGKPLYFISQVQDITGRKQAEQALRESEETLQLFIEHAPAAIAMFDRQMRYLAVSSRWVTDFDLRDKKIIGQSHYDVFPEITEQWKAVHARALAGEVLRDNEDRFERANGNIQWVRWEARPWYAANGVIGGIVIFAEEISERRRAGEALRESEERTHAVLKAIPDLMFLQSREGVYLDYHTPDPRLLLAPPEQFLGKGMHEVMPPELANEFMRCFEEAIRTDEPSMHEYSLQLPEGTRHFEARMAKCNGTKILTVVRDITERKRMEEELRQALLEVRKLKDQLQDENVYLQEEVRLAHDFGQIIGHSGSLKSALLQAEQVAPTDSTVLITGETGTGKELIARAIHSISARRDRPLVRVNCAVLPATIIESELFGHEKGAFTGATARRVGRFELADGGTIFLDEIGELPLELQAKLLRVLQEGEFERLGSSRTVKVDVRVLAATNQNLEEAAQAGKFRADLYYRLSVFPIHLPALRERQEDIRPLVNFYVEQCSQKLGKPINIIPAGAMQAMERYAWPGNVRELKNVIERAVILSSDGKLRLAESLQVHGAAKADRGDESEKAVAAGLPSAVRLDEVERDHILRVMEQTFWRVEGEGGAAEILGLNPGTLRSRLKKLGLRRPAPRK